MPIPFMNLKRQNDSLREEYLTALGRILDHGTYILGPEVQRFEEEFAALVGVRYCLGTSNGTTALHLALAGLGIGPGDEVIVPVNTFVATAEAVVHCGARPVFVDILPDGYQLDPEKVKDAITCRTRAILPVHLYGCPAPMDLIMELANYHGLAVVEDAAQAHLAEFHGKKVGSFGAAAAFSFYPGKNLGALGDGGAVVTNDPELYRKMRMLRDHGSPRKYHHDLVGFNYRMDSFTGAVLSIKLRRLEEWTVYRRQRAKQYRELLADSDLVLPPEPDDVRQVYHLFVVQCERRDQLMEFLNQQGVGTNIHYPVPLHLQPAFAQFGGKEGEYPQAELAARRIFSMPLCSEISAGEVETVCSLVKEGLSRIRG